MSIATRNNKRKNESSPTNTPIVQDSKKTKHYKLKQKDMDELKRLMSDIKSEFSESHNKLVDKIDNISIKFDTEISALNNKIESYSSKVTTNIVNIESQLVMHSERISYAEDDFKRVALSNQLRILGFPFTTNENLRSIFDKIANEIGYEIQNPVEVPTISRIPMRNKSTGEMTSSGTILLEFIANQFKAKFFSMYLHKVPLKADKLGLPINTKVIISENLTKINAELFAAAKTMKRDKKIVQTFTDNGLVYIKTQLGRTNKAILIRSKRQLEQLIGAIDKMDSSQTENATNPQIDVITNSQHPLQNVQA